MRRDRVYLCAAGLLALWFGVVVPGHQRGAVKVPNSKPGSCCPGKVDAGSKKTSDDKAPCDPVSKCAMCYIVGVLDVPGALPAGLPHPELLALIQIASTARVEAVVVLGLLPQRAPPFA